MSTITTIQGSDLIKDSRADINNNFDNLNTDKIETSYLDTDTTLSANSDSKIATQKAVKAYVDSGGNTNASETNKGIVEEATDAEVTAGTATGATGARLFVNPSKRQPRDFVDLHRISTSASLHYYIDNDYTFSTVSGVDLRIESALKQFQLRTLTSDWATANAITSVIILGLYSYTLVEDASHNYRVYRHLLSDLTSSPIQITIDGQSLGTSQGGGLRMTSDGTSFFFNGKGGTSANDYIISKYTLSGTTLTYVSDITCGSSVGTHTYIIADSSSNIYGYKTDNTFRKYNSSGTIQYTTSAYPTASSGLVNIKNVFYTVQNNSSLTRLDRIYLP
jgi:hypothetical protein